MVLKRQPGVRQVRRQMVCSPKLVLDGSEQSIQEICSRWKYEVPAADEAFRLERPNEDDRRESHLNRTAVQPVRHCQGRAGPLQGLTASGAHLDLFGRKGDRSSWG